MGNVALTHPTFADNLNAIASLSNALAWPLVISLALVLFKSEIRGLIKRIKKLDIAGTSLEAEEKIQETVDKSEAAVLKSTDANPPATISTEDIQRSIKVGTLSRDVPPDIIRSQIELIAAEYEGIRANMPSSAERTKRMGAVMAKMRTLGRAVYPYRAELVASSSPGKRLFAIAALQMMPDYGLLNWLANTTRSEAPYVQFQALIALSTAVRHAGPDMKRSLQDAIKIAKSGLSSEDFDRSRWDLASDIELEIEKIPAR